MDLRRIQLAGREKDFAGYEGCGVPENFNVAFTLPLAGGDGQIW